VIADEPTTALDVTIQAQILELLDNLRRKYQLSLILISHDLGVIAEVAETVAVMYAGKIVEIGPAMDVFHNPKHPYTEGLLRSVPRLGASIVRSENRPRLYAIEGVVPNLLHLPDGCSFAPRCYKRTVECTLSGIPLEPVSDTKKYDERSECKRDSAQPSHDEWSECKRDSAQPSHDERSECKRDSAQPSHDERSECKRDSAQPSHDERSECKRDSAQPSHDERSECKRDSAQPSHDVRCIHA
jgi:oligopeptide/dipeptide ABC transporter ATP-binding protein